MEPSTSSFDTLPIRHGARARYWQRAAQDVFDAIDVEPLSRELHARLLRRRLGPLQLAMVESSPVVVRGHSGSRLQGVFVLVNKAGSCVVQQHGRRDELAVGGLTVLDTRAPYRLELTRPHRAQVLFVPGDDWAERLQDHVAVAHSPQASQLLAAFIDRIGVLDPASATGGDLQSLTHQLLHLTWPETRPMVRSAAAPRFGVEALIRWMQVHLADPTLSVHHGARYFGLGARALQAALARRDTSFSRLLLEQRLQVAAQALQEDLQRPVAEIAHEAGFADLPHFCRRFRARFGVSASGYRRER